MRPSLRRRGALAVVLALILGQPAAGSGKPEIEQVREILASSDGTVRKWSYAPQIAVIHDRPFPRPFFERTLARIAEAVPMLQIAPRNIEYLDFAAYPSDPYGRASFRIAHRHGRRYGVLRIHAEPPVAIGAQIFVFYLSIPASTFFAVLVGERGPLLRQFAEGYPTECYYQLYSTQGHARFAFIHVNSRIDAAAAEGCLYEEMMQSLGILNDSEGSTLFTFDNRSGEKPQARDFRLLRALYHPSVAAGDPVQAALEAYRALSD